MFLVILMRHKSFYQRLGYVTSGEKLDCLCTLKD